MKESPITEPTKQKEKEYSGRFILRIPSELHRHLAVQAKENDTTLNQYCLYLLTRKSFLNGIQEELKNVSEEIQNVYKSIREINYKIEPSGWRNKIECYDLHSNVYELSA